MARGGENRGEQDWAIYDAVLDKGSLTQYWLYMVCAHDLARINGFEEQTDYFKSQATHVLSDNLAVAGARGGRPGRGQVVVQVKGNPGSRGYQLFALGQQYGEGTAGAVCGMGMAALEKLAELLNPSNPQQELNKLTAELGLDNPLKKMQNGVFGSNVFHPWLTVANTVLDAVQSWPSNIESAEIHMAGKKQGFLGITSDKHEGTTTLGRLEYQGGIRELAMGLTCWYLLSQKPHTQVQLSLQEHGIKTNTVNLHDYDAMSLATVAVVNMLCGALYRTD